MWGNALGWTISAVLVIAMGALVYLADRQTVISSPGAFSTSAICQSPLTLPVAPQTVLPPSADLSDSGPIYRSAIQAYLSDAAKYRRFVDRGGTDDIPKLDALDLLLKASSSSHARVFEPQPESIVNMHPDRPLLDAASALGGAATRAALMLQSKDPAAAMKYAQAAFSFGEKLFQDRLTAPELMAGLELMSESSVVMKKLAQTSGDGALASRIATFDSARLDFYKQRIEPMLRVLTAVDDKVVSEHAGDVFYLAQHAGDRVWRVEAIFALGRMKYFVGSEGRAADQRGAPRMLQKLTEDSDPVIRAAAAAARDLTIDEYRKQH